MSYSAYACIASCSVWYFESAYGDSGCGVIVSTFGTPVSEPYTDDGEATGTDGIAA
jgi:hypothetical protein